MLLGVLALVSEWGSTKGTCHSPATPEPGHCPCQWLAGTSLWEQFSNTEKFFKATLLKIVGSLKLAWREYLHHGNWHMLQIRAILQRPVCHSTTDLCRLSCPLQGNTAASTALSYGSSLSLYPPAPASGQAMVPAEAFAGFPCLACPTSPPTPAISYLDKLSSLEYGEAFSLWHCRHPRVPHQAGRGCSHWPVSCPFVGSTSVSSSMKQVPLLCALFLIGSCLRRAY